MIVCPQFREDVDTPGGNPPRLCARSAPASYERRNGTTAAPDRASRRPTGSLPNSVLVLPRQEKRCSLIGTTIRTRHLRLATLPCSSASGQHVPRDRTTSPSCRSRLSRCSTSPTWCTARVPYRSRTSVDLARPLAQIPTAHGIRFGIVEVVSSVLPCQSKLRRRSDGRRQSTCMLEPSRRDFCSNLLVPVLTGARCRNLKLWMAAFVGPWPELLLSDLNIHSGDLVNLVRVSGAAEPEPSRGWLPRGVLDPAGTCRDRQPGLGVYHHRRWGAERAQGARRALPV